MKYAGLPISSRTLVVKFSEAEIVCEFSSVCGLGVSSSAPTLKHCSRVSSTGLGFCDPLVTTFFNQSIQTLFYVIV